jgi:hypothetical protein
VLSLTQQQQQQWGLGVVGSVLLVVWACLWEWLLLLLLGMMLLLCAVGVF